ncbi:MAG: hypothetical protein HOD58_15045 [Gammaproteobacteria bacterium]|nr:hypothetical protein [Gammaproteobacteria bacterium]
MNELNKLNEAVQAVAFVLEDVTTDVVRYITEGTVSVEFVVSTEFGREGLQYKGAIIVVAGTGPIVWVDTAAKTVTAAATGGTDMVVRQYNTRGIHDEINSYCEEWYVSLIDPKHKYNQA